MHRTDRLLRAIVTGYSVVGAVMIFLMMLHITADVIGKYLFNQPLPGTIPIVSQYYMVTIAFLPLALVDRQSGQISVEILFNTFPRGLRAAATVFATALGIVVFAAITWATWGEAGKKLAIGAFSYEQGIKVPVWPSYYILPFGTALATLALVWRLIAQLMGVQDPANPVPEQPLDEEGISVD